MSKNCVIITSVISPDSAPLNYSPIRSIYNDQERFEQTLETIRSVREHIPNSDICLVECSPDSEQLKEFSDSVDFFVNLYPNDSIRKNPEKGIGEACMILGALGVLEDKGYANFFKLTGRYLVNQWFDASLYENDKIVLKQTEHYGGISMHTFFYKFPKNQLQFFKNLFKLVTLDLNGECSERYMLAHISMSNVLSVTAPLGITARWSCYSSTADF